MSELSKKDIAEIFSEQLEPFANAIHKDFEQVNLRLDAVESDVRWMKENFSELFTKLDKFITLYEKQEQELEILGAQVRRLEERMARLEKSGSQA